MPRMNLKGKTFGRLTALKEITNKPRTTSGYYWACICSCGKTSEVTRGNLTSGAVSSCGCARGESNTKHGHNKKGKRTKIYNCWAEIMSRCYNKKRSCYKNYGGKGIKVYKPWWDFKNFLRDNKSIYVEGKQIDRINNKEDYKPGNVRWVSSKTNCNNKSNCTYIKYKGEIKTVTEWSEKFKVTRRTIRERAKKNIPLDK